MEIESFLKKSPEKMPTLRFLPRLKTRQLSPLYKIKTTDCVSIITQSLSLSELNKDVPRKAQKVFVLNFT